MRGKYGFPAKTPFRLPNCAVYETDFLSFHAYTLTTNDFIIPAGRANAKGNLSSPQISEENGWAPGRALHRQVRSEGKADIKNDLGKTQAEVKAKLSMEIAEYRKVCITRSGKHAVAEWLVLRNPIDGCVAPKVQRQEMKTP